MVQVTHRRETDRIRKEALKLPRAKCLEAHWCKWSLMWSRAGLIGASGHSRGRARGSDVVPSNPATFALECHVKVVKVPKYGSEGAEP